MKAGIQGPVQPLKGVQAPAQRMHVYLPLYRREKNMNEIWSAVGQYAFPIVMCLVMAWYVKYREDKHSEELKETRSNHSEELKGMTEAINNNTVALQRLTDFMHGDRYDDRN